MPDPHRPRGGRPRAPERRGPPARSPLRALRPHLVLSLGLLLVGASPSRDYREAHRAWTRQLTLYHEFSTALKVGATLLEPPFADMLDAETRRLLGPAAPELEPSSLPATHSIVLAAESALPGPLTFGAPDATWAVVLEVDDQRIPLLAARRVSRPTAMQENLFPQLDAWSDLWLLEFERREAHPETIALHLGSGWGHGTLTWSDLHPEDAGRDRRDRSRP